MPKELLPYQEYRDVFLQKPWKDEASKDSNQQSVSQLLNTLLPLCGFTLNPHV